MSVILKPGRFVRGQQKTFLSMLSVLSYAEPILLSVGARDCRLGVMERFVFLCGVENENERSEAID
jgi:hypothetical protein